MNGEEFSALARDRYSVRDFRPDPIPDDVLDAILDDARYSPSWSNTRPYLLAVASGEQADRLRTAYLAEFDEAKHLQRRRPLDLVKAAVTGRLPDSDFPVWRPYPPDLKPGSVKVGKALYTHLGIARGDREARDDQNRQNCAFFGAPTVVLVFVHRKMLPFSAHDAGLMLQTLMLSAWARGVGSCCLGTLALWRRPVDAEFDIPADYKLITGLALGYASDAPVNDFRADHPPVRRAEARGRQS